MGRARCCGAVIPELDVAFGAEGAAFYQLALLFQEVLDSNALVGKDLIPIGISGRPKTQSVIHTFR